jgi:hypothetical protein
MLTLLSYRKRPFLYLGDIENLLLRIWICVTLAYWICGLLLTHKWLLECLWILRTLGLIGCLRKLLLLNHCVTHLISCLILWLLHLKKLIWIVNLPHVRETLRLLSLRLLGRLIFIERVIESLGFLSSCKTQSVFLLERIILLLLLLLIELVLGLVHRPNKLRVGHSCL